MKFLKSLVAVAAIAAFGSAGAVDAFDSGNSVLSLETVQVGGTLYRNVAVQITGYNLLGVDGGAAQQTTFDTSTNVLRLGAVALNGTVYNNVRVQITGYNLQNSGSSFTSGTVMAANYAAGTEAAGYLAAVNKARTECGLPALYQNAALDTASVNVGNTGYTAVGATQNLARNAGYQQADTVGGVGATYGSNSTDKTAVGGYIAKVSMADPGGLLEIARPYSEIGMTSNLGKAGAVNQRGIGVVMGNTQRIVPAGTVVTLPCANSTDAAPGTGYGVNSVMYAATPMTAGIGNISFGLTNGVPIAVMANPGDTLRITSAAIVQDNGYQVPVTIFDSTTPVNGWSASYKPINSNEGGVYSTARQAENAGYTATIYGTVNGIAFKKEFTFRTGSAIPYNQS